MASNPPDGLQPPRAASFSAGPAQVATKRPAPAHTVTLDPVAFPDATTPVLVRFVIPNVGSALIANESPYAIKVDGGASTKWISAWTADIVPLDSSARGSLTMTPVLIASAVNSPSAQALITLATGDDVIPGTFPVALTRQTNIATGSVTILGTSAVTISGTPTVQFAAGQSVSISGTPSVTIASGSVAITGTPNVNIAAQSVVLNQATPQVLLDTIAVVASSAKNEALTDPSHAMALALDGTFAGSLIVSVKGVTTGVLYSNVSLQAGGFVVVPVFSKLDASVTLTWTLSGGVGGNLRVLSVQASIYAIANGPLPPQSAESIIPADYSSMATSQPGAGVVASVTLGAVPGQRYRCHSLSVAAVQPTGTAGGISPTLQDGAGALLWVGRIGVTGTFGQADHVDKEGCAFLGSVNTAMTLSCGNAVTGAFESAAIGAYSV